MTDPIHEVIQNVLIIHIHPLTQECSPLELRKGWIMLPFTDEVIYTQDGRSWEVLAIKQREWGHEIYVRAVNL